MSLSVLYKIPLFYLCIFVTSQVSLLDQTVSNHGKIPARSHTFISDFHTNSAVNKKARRIRSIHIFYSNQESTSVALLTFEHPPSYRQRRSDDCTPDHIGVRFTADNNEVKLSLQRNYDINVNAPLFVNINGTITQESLENSENIAVYQDLESGSSILVQCITSTRKFELFGTFYNGSEELMIEPELNDGQGVFPAASLSDIQGRNAKSKKEQVSQDEDLKEKFTISHHVIFKGKTMRPKESDYILKGDLHPKHRDGAGHSARNKRATTAYQVELLMVVDYSAYSFWLTKTSSSAAAKILLRQFYAFVLNGIDLRYKSVTGSGFTITVLFAGLYIAETPSDALWTESRKVASGSVYQVTATAALDDFRTWIQNTPNLPGHDHAMLFTAYDLEVNGNNAVAGLAYTEAACTTYSQSIVEDNFDAKLMTIAAHELGHGLGAYHDGTLDGTGDLCLPTRAFIMSASVTLSHLGTSGFQYNKNLWKFSSCSLSYFQRYINTLDSTNCLTTLSVGYNSTALSPYDQQNPGQIYSADTQCRYKQSNDSYLCRSFYRGNYTTVCSAFYCQISGTIYCSLSIAAERTTCGDGKWCLAGECVTATEAPSVNDTCPFGDQPGIVADGQTCTQLVASSSFNCYNYAGSCCQSCQSVYTGIIGCEYGDIALGCIANNCGFYDNTSLALCCKTCYVQPTTITTARTSTTTTAAHTTVTITPTTTSTTTVRTTTTTAASTSSTLAPTTTQTAALITTTTSAFPKATNTTVAPTSSSTTAAPTSTKTTAAPTPSSTTAAVPTASSTITAPIPSSTTAAPTPSSTTAVPTSTSTTAIPTPSSTTAAPTSTKTTAAPTPSSTTAAVPTASSTITAPIPSSTTATPTPSSTTAVPTSTSTTAIPTPSSTTAAPTSTKTTAAPTPSSTTAAVPTANSTITAPIPSSTTAVPTPSSRTAAPTSTTTTVVPTPSSTTAALSPSSTTAAPTPSSTTAAPTSNSTTAYPTPSSTTAAPFPSLTTNTLTPSLTTTAKTPSSTTSAPTSTTTTAAPNPSSTTATPTPTTTTATPTPSSTTAAPTPSSTTAAPTPSSTTSAQTPSSTTAVPTQTTSTASPTPTTSTSAQNLSSTTAAQTPTTTTAAPKSTTTTAAPTPSSTTTAPTPSSTATVPSLTTTTATPTPSSITAAPTPSSTIATPTPTTTTASPTPSSTTAAPAPSSTTAAPTPSSTTSAQTPSSTTAVPTQATSAASPTPTTSTSAPNLSSTTAAQTQTATTSAPKSTTTTAAPTPSSTTTAPTPSSTATVPSLTTTTATPTPSSITAAPTPSSTTAAPTPSSTTSTPTPSSSISDQTPSSTTSAPTPYLTTAAPTQSSTTSAPTPSSTTSAQTPSSTSAVPVQTISTASPTPTTKAAAPTQSSTTASPTPTTTTAAPNLTTKTAAPTPSSTTAAPTPSSTTAAPTPSSTTSTPTPSSSISVQTPSSTTSAPTPYLTTVAPSPSSTTAVPTQTTSTVSPTPTITTAAPTPTTTTSAPHSTTTTAAPTPSSTTAAPTPTTTTAAPTPSSTTATPAPTTTTVAPTSGPSTAAPTPNSTTAAPTPSSTAAVPTQTATTAAPTPTVSNTITSLPTTSMTATPTTNTTTTTEQQGTKKTAVTVRLNYNISSADNLSDSSTYARYVDIVGESLREYYTRKVGQDVQINIRDIRRGSLIVQYELVIINTPIAQSALAKANIDLAAGENITVGGQVSGVESMVVENKTVPIGNSSKDHLCTVYILISGGCPDNYKCVVFNSSPLCQPITTTMDIVPVTVAAAVAGFVIVVAVVALICSLQQRFKKRDKHMAEPSNDSRSESEMTFTQPSYFIEGLPKQESSNGQYPKVFAHAHKWYPGYGHSNKSFDGWSGELNSHHYYMDLEH